MLTAVGDNQDRDDERDCLFGHHQKLGPRSNRGDVGRAERGGGGEREVEIVQEFGIPTIFDVLTVRHFREDERGFAGAVGAGRRATAVEVPVPQAEGNHVGEPDRAARGEQCLGVVRERRRVDDVSQQFDGRYSVRERDHTDQDVGQHASQVA